MLAFGRDLLSPLLNLGWFVGCLVACWCIGRPYRVGAWSLILGAVALSVPALSDQAGEARNDIVGIFFLLAAVAIALHAWAVREEGEPGLSTGRARGRRACGRACRRHQAQLPPAGGGSDRRPGRDRTAGWTVEGLCPRRSRGARRRRLLVPAQPRPQRQPSALGPSPRPDLPARARAGPRWARSAQRPRLPHRRHGLVGLAPAGSARWSLGHLAAARPCGPRRPRSLPRSPQPPVSRFEIHERREKGTAQP